MLRYLIILFVIGPFLVSGARAGAYPADEAPTLRIARVIEVTDGSTIYALPIWSPDGKELAFITGGFTGVYVRNADGSGPIQEITSADYRGYRTVWPCSFDVRLEMDGRNRKLWIVEGDGTRRLEFPHQVLLATLSPTCDLVAFGQADPNLYVSKLDGSSLVNLGPGESWDWSPDGKRLVCLGAIEDSHFDMVASELFVVNADGTARIQLTDTPDVVEMYPRWSPDGTRIAYSTHRTGKICVAILEEVK